MEHHADQQAPEPDPNQELNDRRIAEFAVEESRLSNVAYRFQLTPRPRVWKNWDRTEFEPNHFKVVGLAGVCLKRDELEKAHRTASRSLEEVDGILFVVEEPARADHRPRSVGNLRDHAAADRVRGDHGRQRRELRPRARGPRVRLSGRARGGEDPQRRQVMAGLFDHLAGEMDKLRAAGTYKEELVLQSPRDRASGSTAATS